jgi:hypothetical protein
MTPVTIGDQKFIKDIDKGWIDSKTKQPADKGLIRLLDSLVVNEPALKRLRSKIDRTVEPVSFGGQKFVYDVNQGWIDEKTKIPVPPSLQRTLSNLVPRFGKNDSSDIDLTAGFGIVGSAGLQQTKTTTPRKKTGSGTLVYTNINKPIVKMIGTLATIDALLKQRLNNQKIIAENEMLSARESQIEANNQLPQLQTVKPDAEKVSGSAAGALAIGGLLLLTLDPVQEAIKSIASGVVETGKFITGVVSSINKAFAFLFSSTAKDPTAIEIPTDTAQPGKTTSATPVDNSTPETPVDAEPVTTEEKPSFTAAVAAGAATGAVVGSVVPRVGMFAGAAVGGAIAAVKHVSGGSTGSASSSSSTSATPQATQVAPASSAPTMTTSTPDATQSAPAGSAPDAKAESKEKKPAAAGAIPKNNIVALGNYLIGQGADRSKLQHSAFGSVGQHSKNSRHYRGMAIDVNFSGPGEDAKLDALEPQLRAAGYNTIWRKPGHYTHMHVSTGGPEGGGGSSMGDSHTFMQVAADTVNAGAGKIGELFGMLGSAIIKPGVPRDKEDYSKAITAAAVQTNTETAVAKTPKPLPNLSAPKPANINKSGTGATQNAATSTDKDSVYYYLRRFGFQELSAPVKPAAMA